MTTFAIACVLRGKRAFQLPIIIGHGIPLVWSLLPIRCIGSLWRGNGQGIRDGRRGRATAHTARRESRDTGRAPGPAAAGGDRHTGQARARAADGGTQVTAQGTGKGTGRMRARAAAPGDGHKHTGRVPRQAATGRTGRARAQAAGGDTTKDTGKDTGGTRASAKQARARVTEVSTGDTAHRARGRECAQTRG